jgi:hypothetical protein
VANSSQILAKVKNKEIDKEDQLWFNRLRIQPVFQVHQAQQRAVRSALTGVGFRQY